MARKYLEACGKIVSGHMYFPFWILFRVWYAPKTFIGHPFIYFSFKCFLLIASHTFTQASTSSKDEWQGKELGTRGGKAVHMLIHHRYTFRHCQLDVYYKYS